MKDDADFVHLGSVEMAGIESASGNSAMEANPALDSASTATIEEASHPFSVASPRNTVGVSVIIPYTKPGTVGNAISSVLQQDYPAASLEIIVVGKGSEALRQRYPQIAPVELQYRAPPGRARNLGAAVARGEVLLYLDDDCEAQPGWVTEALAELDTEGVGAVSGKILGKSRALFARCTDYSNFGSCAGDSRKKGRLWTATFGIRRKLFDAYGGFDETLSVQEDIDLCFRLNRDGYDTIHQPKIIVLHNHGRTSLRSLLRYQYQNGRSGGLEVESRYPEVGLRNRLLSRLTNPLLYLPLAAPFALIGTLQAVRENVLRDPAIVLLAPIILLAKLSCHLGILHSLLSHWLRGSWIRSGKVRAVLTTLEYSLLKAGFRTPRVLTLYVTSACNAKCKHCFYWQNLNQKSDLAMGEIDELSRSLGKIDKLLIGGGEPFLRRDLPEICELFIRQNDVEIISIPTNALLPDLIVRQLRKILAVADGRAIRVNLSLDGSEPVHDDIRGVPGSFRKVVETFQKVRQLRVEYPNLTIGIISCVMNANHRDLYGLYDEFPDLFPGVDMPGLILLRGDPNEPELELPSLEELEALHAHKRNMAAGSQPLLWKLADIANFRIGLESIRTESQAIPCEAGRILGVVEDNGNVRHCELLPPIGNLREMGFREIWNSAEAVAARERIARGECHCTHECNVFESLMAHPVAAAGVLARAEAKYRRST